MIQLSFELRSSGTATKTINFQADGRRVIDPYIPQTSSGEKVTDTFLLYIKGDDNADLAAKVREIEALLKFARDHATGPEGVWALYSPDTTTAWQSRVSDGSLMLDERITQLWRQDKVRCQIVFERDNFWESKESVTLALTNGSVTGQNAAPISNCQDGSHDLYVEIAADQVTGVLPTPAILEFKNTLNDTTLLDDLLVGVLQGDGLTTPPAPATLVCEGSGTIDAACSGGEYQALSWSNAAENQLTTWTLASGSFLQKTYRAVARLQAALTYDDLWLKAKLLAGNTLIAETRWMLVEAGQELVVIGSLTIPPYPLGEAINVGNLTLALYEKRASGSGALNLDYVLLMPQDAWRRYGAITGLAYNEILVDNPVRGVLVTSYSTGSYKVTHKIEEGRPLMLRPGVKNILTFLQADTTGEAPIGRTASVTVKVHPRRLTV